MKICYNTSCPFNGDKPCECDCAGMCERFADSPLIVRTSNRTEPATQRYASTTTCLQESKEEC